MSILSELEQTRVRNQCYAIMQSSQGKDLGRVFLKELGKPEPEFARVLNEVVDIWVEVVRSLYVGDKPVLSRSEGT